MGLGMVKSRTALGTPHSSYATACTSSQRKLKNEQKKNYRILISSCLNTDIRLFDFYNKRGLGADQSHYNQPWTQFCCKMWGVLSSFFLLNMKCLGIPKQQQKKTLITKGK